MQKGYIQYNKYLSDHWLFEISWKTFYEPISHKEAWKISWKFLWYFESVEISACLIFWSIMKNLVFSFFWSSRGMSKENLLIPWNPKIRTFSFNLLSFPSFLRFLRLKPLIKMKGAISWGHNAKEPFQIPNWNSKAQNLSIIKS